MILFITGGAGFIGSNFINNFKKMFYSNDDLETDDIKIINFDIRNTKKLSSVINCLNSILILEVNKNVLSYINYRKIINLALKLFTHIYYRVNVPYNH